MSISPPPLGYARFRLACNPPKPHGGVAAEPPFAARLVKRANRDDPTTLTSLSTFRTVIVVALGSAGDVHPNVALAVALKRGGRRVIFVSSAVFASLARRVGLEFAALGSESDYYDVINDPAITDPRRAFTLLATRMIVPAMRETYRIIAKTHETSDTVVVAPGLAFGARIAQERLGVPLATVHLQPAALRSVYQPPLSTPGISGSILRTIRRLYLRMIDRFVCDPLLAPAVNAFRAELGLQPVARFLHRWLHSPRLVIGLFPDWYGPAEPDWPSHVHHTGFPLYDESDVRTPHPEIAGALEGPEPPIVITAGSSVSNSAEFFGVSAEMCKRTGRSGILLTPFREQVPRQLPRNVRHFNYVPFSGVLPRAAAFVHHGGVGTVALGLAAGVPQLVVPFAHDQPDNAIRVERLGVGYMLTPETYNIDNAVARIEQLLGSCEIRDNCRRRAQDVAPGQASLEKACRLIEGLRR